MTGIAAPLGRRIGDTIYGIVGHSAATLFQFRVRRAACFCKLHCARGAARDSVPLWGVGCGGRLATPARAADGCGAVVG